MTLITSERETNKQQLAYMKMARFTVALGVTGLFLGLGGVGGSTALAQTDTYSFTATAGQDGDFNGSTITIDGLGATGVSAFSFYDAALSPTPFTSGTVVTEYIASYSTSGWVGEFEIHTGGDYFTASYTNFIGSGGGAAGSWSYEPAGAGGSVPDETNTCSLLAAGVGAMVLWLNRLAHESLVRTGTGSRGRGRCGSHTRGQR
jgi:hypothetical protein